MTPSPGTFRRWAATIRGRRDSTAASGSGILSDMDPPSVKTK
jgi:hypothetical protein